tara:strand:+ start:64 stop:672 length:609 start_codon:yes stop_codon:yes gene_type:complete
MSIVKLNNKAVSNATAFGSISSLGSMTFIKKLTASSSATLSFVDGSGGVDFSTYKEYVFTFKDIHPATNVTNFTFQADTGTNTSYNQTMTTTQFNAQHDESGSSGFGYNQSGDQANGTAFQSIMERCGNDNDSCLGGELTIYNPSSTVFVKHFIAKTQVEAAAESRNFFTAGYFNTSTALTRVQFKMASGNFDGDICLYGIA